MNTRTSGGSGKSLLIRGARQLLTMRGGVTPKRGTDMNQLGIIEDGALLIVDGMIQEVGTSRRVENLAAARTAREIDASNCVVMPALIDCVSRPPLTTSGSMLWEPGFPSALSQQQVNQIRAERFERMRSTSPRNMQAILTDFLDVAQRSGTGLTEARIDGDLDLQVRVLRALKRIGATDRVIPTFDATAAARALPDQEASLEDLHSRVVSELGHDRVASTALLAPATSWPAHQLERLAQSLRRLGWTLRVESPETLDGQTLDLALRCQVRSLDQVAILTVDATRKLAASNTVVVLTPRHTIGDRPWSAPARYLLEQGGIVALASGFEPGVCPVVGLLLVAALACFQLKMSPAEALTAITQNAACVLGVANQYGSLETGKRGDILILEARDYRDTLQNVGAPLLRTMVKAGRVLGYAAPRLAQAV